MNKANYSRSEKLRFAAEMASNPTPAEAVLYRALSTKRIRFYKQYLIGGYIVDAYLPDLKIGIECDGGYHGEIKQRIYDIDRDKAIKEFQVKVKRFSNDEIMDDPIKCIESVIGKGKTPNRKSKKYKVSPINRLKAIKKTAREKTAIFEAMSKMPSSVFKKKRITSNKLCGQSAIGRYIA